MTEKETYGIIGMKFGRLEVLELDTSPVKIKRGPRYVCLCSCGTVKTVAKNHLLSGATRSCGCLRKETLKEKRHTKASLPEGEATFRAVYRGYQREARIMDRAFSLTLDQFRTLTQSPCTYCGKEPHDSYSPTRAKASPFIGNGIDRVDNTKGYSLENAAPCCRTCNFMKGSKSAEEFLESVRAIYEHNFKNV